MINEFSIIFNNVAINCIPQEQWKWCVSNAHARMYTFIEVHKSSPVAFDECYFRQIEIANIKIMIDLHNKKSSIVNSI